MLALRIAAGGRLMFFCVRIEVTHSCEGKRKGVFLFVLTLWQHVQGMTFLLGNA